jgi:DNA-binding CsgD family transcriptional regulator
MKGIGNKQFKLMFRILGITSLIFLPLIFLEHIRVAIPELESLIWLETLSLPLFLLVINIESLFFGRSFFDMKPAIDKGELIEEFCVEFSITEREKEVAQLYVKGDTFAEIGEKLFISPRTVDKHIENLYSKTGVRNRAQLIHLLLGST